MWDNRNSFDFRVTRDTDVGALLTFVVQHDTDDDGLRGIGVVLNETYEERAETPVINDLWEFNIHEYNVLPGGHTALVCAYRSEWLEHSQVGMPGQSGYVLTGGIEEIDVFTGEVLFDWRGLDHIPIWHSTIDFPVAPLTAGLGWDYM